MVQLIFIKIPTTKLIEEIKFSSLVFKLFKLFLIFVWLYFIYYISLTQDVVALLQFILKIIQKQEGV